MPTKKITEWATIGKIVAPFGLRGQMKVRSLTDIPDRFSHLENVFLGPEYKSYAIKEVRPYRSNLILLKLAGIASATAAESLRDQDIFIPEAEMAKLPPDFYYQHDIVGLAVERVSGQAVGTIVEIMPTGGNDVYVVKAPDGKQFLIPAVKSIIKQVDLIRHVMYIEPIGGMLDDDAVIDEQESSSEEGEEEAEEE